MLIFSDTSLSESEKEDREAESLLKQKPPPSRKHKERRAPRPWQRRRRVNIEDPDLSKSATTVADMLSCATSNKIYSDRVMPNRQATYHGVLQQGNPAGPTNTDYKSYDKRYFTQENFDSIVKYAKSLLDEDWLKYEWDNRHPDARFRAALDLSIQLADHNLYQSKIDAETYDMLLNRLAGWDHDSFSETVYSPVEGSKRNAMSKEHVRNILKVASELQSSDPTAAFHIVKNLRALVSSEAEHTPSISKLAQQEEQQEQEEGKTSQQQEQGQEQQQAQQQQSQEQQGQQEQQAQKPGGDIEFKSLSDQDFKKIKDEAKKLFDSKDVEEFMKGFDALSDDIGKKTASSRVNVPLSLLVRVAHANPDSRSVLLPIIVAARKKSKPKKTSQQEQSADKASKKEEAEEKAAKDKKSPPKKVAPKGKSKKASAPSILAEDMSW